LNGFFFILFFLQIFMIFLRIYQQQKIKILLTGHSRQPVTRHEKGRGEIFNPPPLVSPPHSAHF
jgi:hypothetical protein